MLSSLWNRYSFIAFTIVSNQCSDPFAPRDGTEPCGLSLLAEFINTLAPVRLLTSGFGASHHRDVHVSSEYRESHLWAWIDVFIEIFLSIS